MVAANRESEALDVLNTWPWDTAGCLIGGYSLAAYDAARFSLDLDIVIPFPEEQRISSWLNGAGFRSRIRQFGPASAPKVIQAERGLLTVDLMVGGVVDRESGVQVSAEWIARQSVHKALLLRTGTTRAEVTVARLEAVWALKLIAARDQDVADLFACMSHGIDTGEVQSLLTEIWNPQLEGKIRRLLLRLEGPKLFQDSLSRLGRGSPKSVKHRAEWTRFIDRVTEVLPTAFAEHGSSKRTG